MGSLRGEQIKVHEVKLKKKIKKLCLKTFLFEVIINNQANCHFKPQKCRSCLIASNLGGSFLAFFVFAFPISIPSTALRIESRALHDR